MIGLNSMVDFYSSFGYLAVFGVLLLCGFGLPIPEDISLLAGGIISGMEYTNVHLMVLIGFVGVMVGDSIIYQLGYRFGNKIFQKKIVARSMNPQWYHRIYKSFQKNGKWVLFAARFMPGLRTPIFLTAGITRFVRFRTFFLIDGIAALISVPVWVYLGYFGASNRDLLISWMRDTKIGIVGLLFAILLFWIISRFAKKKIQKAEIISDENGNGSNSEK